MHVGRLLRWWARENHTSNFKPLNSGVHSSTMQILLSTFPSPDTYVTGYTSGICIQWTGVLDWSPGMECWNGVLEWNHWNGVKHWSGPACDHFRESFRMIELH